MASLSSSNSSKSANKKVTELLQELVNNPSSDGQRRQYAKQGIKEPLGFIVGEALKDDPKYSQQVGVISRAYKATGLFGYGDFDIHLPLTLAHQFEVQTQVQSLPVVYLVSKNEKAQYSRDWGEFIEGRNLSATKLRADLHRKLVQAADKYNYQFSETGIPLLSGVEFGQLNPGQPVRARIKFPSGSQLFLDFAPVVFGLDVNGLENIRDKIKTSSSEWIWPQEEEKRAEIVDMISLIPWGETAKWQLSLSLGHKHLIKSLEDGGQTCRLLLYRAFKQINKRYWNTDLTDQEGIKLGAHCLQQVFFQELSKMTNLERDWNNEKIGQRFKGLLQEMRNKFSQGEVKDYFIPGKHNNSLTTYKQQSFLTTKLANIVRRIEIMVKNPENALNDLVLQNRKAEDT